MCLAHQFNLVVQKVIADITNLGSFWFYNDLDKNYAVPSYFNIELIAFITLQANIVFVTWHYHCLSKLMDNRQIQINIDQNLELNPFSYKTYILEDFASFRQFFANTSGLSFMCGSQQTKSLF